jgi:hypothetical protein
VRVAEGVGESVDVKVGLASFASNPPAAGVGDTLTDRQPTNAKTRDSRINRLAETRSSLMILDFDLPVVLYRIPFTVVLYSV